MAPGKTPYNPALHITAEELRFAGFSIPDNVPGFAYVSRASLKLDVGKCSMDNDKFTASINCEILEPFTWIDMTFVLEKDHKEEPDSGEV